MELTLNSQHALNVMLSGVNIFLSGAAGNGKSNLISKFIEENRDKNIIICAPASTADISFGGDTLRSIFGMPTGVLRVGDYNAKPGEAIKRADIIIVDQINICRIDVFEYMIHTLQKMKRRNKSSGETDHLEKQIILIGDFYKAPPVLRKEDKKAFVSEWGFKRETDLFAFNSSLWDELNLESIILEDSHHPKNDLKTSENPNENETDVEPTRIFTVVTTFYNDIAGSRTLNSSHFRKVSAEDYSGWDDEEDTLLQDEWSRGLGIDEISRLHNRTVGAIRTRLIKI